MTVVPQTMTYDSALTYSAVSSTDYIAPVGAQTFIHFINASATNDVITYSGLETTSVCQAVVLYANTDIILGPFDLTNVGYTLVVRHSYTTSVTMAAATPQEHNHMIGLHSGATAWDFPNITSEKITIPKGAAIDNLVAVTFDYVVYLHNSYIGPPMVSTYLFYKQSTAGYFGLLIDGGSGDIILTRYMVGGGYYQAVNNERVIRGHDWYDIQISWACGSGAASASTPRFMVNGEEVPITVTTSGSIAAWSPDNTHDAILANNAAGSNGFFGILAVARIYSNMTPLSLEEMYANYVNDMWRYSAAADVIITGVDITDEYEVIPGTLTGAAPISPIVIEGANVDMDYEVVGGTLDVLCLAVICGDY